jgi:hypothetical protein
VYPNAPSPWEAISRYAILGSMTRRDFNRYQANAEALRQNTPPAYQQ